MQSRFQKRKEKAGPSYDSLVIEDFDWDNEWTDSSVVHNDLTWGQVDEATRASNSLRGRNLPRQARGGRVRTQEVVGEEDGNDSSNEDLEEDPHDDVDVSDSDAASEDEDGGENNAPTFPDEFDDGY